ncbi:hypothetical protein B0H14DRAFT_3784920 [Mycena olivaceomarginata]|nr:hypothetical protein B0H14DRAFT_3784920 [Mycena olivaceomarginata]
MSVTVTTLSLLSPSSHLMPTQASTKDILARARLRRQNAPPPSNTPSSPVLPATPSLPPLPPLFDLTPGPSSTTPVSTLNIRGTSMAQLKSFGECELKRVKLQPSTESNFRTYLITNSKDEHNALQAMWTLQVRDQLSKLTQNTAEAWAPSGSLERAARRNIYSLVLLPNVHLYAGTSGDLVMRAVATLDLLNSDSVHVDELVAWLNEEISQARYAIKKKIIENSRSNVADIAEELLSLTHAHFVPHTLGLYMRLALLRRHLALNHTTNAFWGKVDNEMEDARAAGGAQSLVDLLETIYEEDIEEFEDPAKTEHTVKSFTDPSFDCPLWLRELHKVAPQVKPLPKQKGKSKKRKRIATEDVEDAADEPCTNRSRGDDN